MPEYIAILLILRNLKCQFFMVGLTTSLYFIYYYVGTENKGKRLK